MAVTTDIGEAKDIHPQQTRRRQASRCGLWPRCTVKRFPTGPIIASHAVSGEHLVLTFDHAEGIKAGGAKLLGFEIAGADKKWHPAEAKIEGATVVLASPEVKQPASARYNWDHMPTGNLTNNSSLPASPFSTE